MEATLAVKSPRVPIPTSIRTMALTLPQKVTTGVSPYPTVVMVWMTNQRLSKRVLTPLAGALRSSRYSVNVPYRMTPTRRAATPLMLLARALRTR